MTRLRYPQGIVNISAMVICCTPTAPQFKRGDSPRLLFISPTGAAVLTIPCTQPVSTQPNVNTPQFVRSRRRCCVHPQRRARALAGADGPPPAALLRHPGLLPARGLHTGGAGGAHALAVLRLRAGGYVSTCRPTPVPTTVWQCLPSVAGGRCRLRPVLRRWWQRCVFHSAARAVVDGDFCRLSCFSRVAFMESLARWP